MQLSQHGLRRTPFPPRLPHPLHRPRKVSISSMLSQISTRPYVQTSWKLDFRKSLDAKHSRSANILLFTKTLPCSIESHQTFCDGSLVALDLDGNLQMLRQWVRHVQEPCSPSGRQAKLLRWLQPSGTSDPVSSHTCKDSDLPRNLFLLRLTHKMQLRNAAKMPLTMQWPYKLALGCLPPADTTTVQQYVLHRAADKSLEWCRTHGSSCCNWTNSVQPSLKSDLTTSLHLAALASTPAGRSVYRNIRCRQRHALGHGTQITSLPATTQEGCGANTPSCGP